VRAEAYCALQTLYISMLCKLFVSLLRYHCFLLLFVTCLYFPFLFTSLFFPLSLAPLCFQVGCRRRRLNLGLVGYNLSRFYFVIVLFCVRDLNSVDLVSIDLVLC